MPDVFFWSIRNLATGTAPPRPLPHWACTTERNTGRGSVRGGGEGGAVEGGEAVDTAGDGSTAETSGDGAVANTAGEGSEVDIAGEDSVADTAGRGISQDGPRLSSLARRSAGLKHTVTVPKLRWSL